MRTRKTSNAPNRFKVVNWDGKHLFETDDLEKVYKYLTKKRTVIKCHIYDHVDDIHVHETDFIELWEAGERPKDLSMF